MHQFQPDPDPTLPLAPPRRLAVEWGVVLCLGCLSAVLLFWNLSQPYLWQDEANTAVLAVRLLQSGKPLAYDGVNILTNDNFAAENQRTIGERTGNPQVAVDYYIARGDLKADGTWKFHPLGQFLWAAAGIKLWGQTTLGARLPFVIAALASVFLLYWLVRSSGGGLPMAGLASLILTLNVYWLLHSRQCRYYALSGLCFLLTLLAYQGWRAGKRWGWLWLAVACWVWFHVDYGTVWPVFGVLFGYALLEDGITQGWRAAGKTVALGGGLTVALIPSVVYYELWGRQSVQIGDWAYRFMGTCFNINEFILPISLLILTIALLVLRWRQWPAAERRLVAVAAATMVAMIFWVPTVAPEVFVRYLIIVAPAGCLLAAWGLTRLLTPLSPLLPPLFAALLIVTPWFCKPLSALIDTSGELTGGAFLRSEWAVLREHIFATRPDPNRAVIDWLAANAQPNDEVLINYEDAPLMYYLPNPIRGGIPAFRAEDDARLPPKFAVMRQSVPFVHWAVFERELDRYSWQRIPLRAPDVIWGNIPDPMQGMLDPYHAEDLILLRRIEAPQ